MVATVPPRRTASSPRVMRDLTIDRPIDDLTVIRLTVAEGSKSDGYLLLHWSDSLEVRVSHQDDPARSYVVTCSPGTGVPTRCTCPGSQYRGGGCRHRAAVAKLTELGLLALPVLEDAGHDRATTE